eukprot:m.291546 g.291546  ORF g.291546 m.291546 type:complete len:90 (-) comp55099_c0_seq3:50-319(-)
MLDHPDFAISDALDLCLPFIEEAVTARSAVLVHCNAGVSRSVTVVLAYLMRKQGFALDDALALVKDKRPCAQPNSGFLAQLRKLESAST